MSPANKYFLFYFKSIPSLLLFLSFIEYSIVKSLSLSFPHASFCFTSYEVPQFPPRPPPIYEQLIELVFPVSTHHFILLNSVQFSAGGHHQLYFCPTGGQVVKALWAMLCLCVAATFTRITDCLASKQKGKVAQFVSSKGQRADLQWSPCLSKPLDSVCLSWAKTLWA